MRRRPAADGTPAARPDTPRPAPARADPPPRPPSRRLVDVLPLVAVLALALALRVYGLTWGLPDQHRLLSYHPDEGPNLVQGLLDEGRLRPHLDLGFYNYGGLYFYLWQGMALANTTYGLVSLPPTGAPDKPAPDSAAALILVGRLLTVLCGVLATWAVYALGRRLYGRPAGVAAAAMWAIVPAAVVHGHYATVDVPATLFVTLALVWSARALGEGRQPVERAYPCDSGVAPHRLIASSPHLPLVVSGALSGLAAAAKYNCGIVLLAPLAATWLCRRQGARWWLAPAVVGAAAVGFVVGCPGCLLDWERFAHDVGYELAKSREGMALLFADTGNGWLYHLVTSLRFGVSTPLLAFCLAALVLALVRRTRQDWLLLAFLVPYYLVIGAAQVRFLRYIIPLLPVLAALAGRLAFEPWPRRALRWLVPALGAAAALVALVVSLGMNHLMAVPDARDQALAAIERNVPPGSAIAFAETPWYDLPPLSPGFTLLSPRDRRRAAEEVTRWALLLPAPDTEWDMAVFSPPPGFALLSDVQAEDAIRLNWAPARPYLDTLQRDYVRRDFQNLPTVLGFRMAKPAWVPNDWLYTWPRISLYTRRSP